MGSTINTILEQARKDIREEPVRAEYLPEIIRLFRKMLDVTSLEKIAERYLSNAIVKRVVPLTVQEILYNVTSKKITINSAKKLLTKQENAYLQAQQEITGIDVYI